jgi:hypothetical protein
MKLNIIKSFLFIIILLIPIAGISDIYKFQDADGRDYYTDKPTNTLWKRLVRTRSRWTLVSSSPNENMNSYVDFESLRKNDYKPKMWLLWDFKSVQQYSSYGYLSSMEQTEFDCRKEQTRTLAYTYYSGNMGKCRSGFFLH